jgi:general secretion pathway protein G
MTTTQRRIARAGFSLMEIMIAVTILGLVMAMVAPALQNTLRKGKIRTAKSSLKGFQQGIEEYQMEVGKLPQTLKDLIKKPRDEAAAKKWEGPYLKKADEIPVDPFENPFVYKLTPGAKHPYEMYSRGPNGADAPKEEWISVWDE